MAMGTRKQREKQEDLWIAHTELAAAPGHPFYQRLNELLEAEGFDEFVEGRCAKFYAEKYGRPSLTPEFPRHPPGATDRRQSLRQRPLGPGSGGALRDRDDRAPSRAAPPTDPRW